MRGFRRTTRNETQPNTDYVYLLLAETKAAVRSLYELHQNPASVEPLYLFARDALDAIRGEVDKINDPLPSPLPAPSLAVGGDG